MTKKPSGEQVQYLAKVYHGCVADGLEWAMAHLDYKDDSEKIRIMLLDLGYIEMAATWEKLQELFFMQGEVASTKFKEVEAKAIADGVIERFCVKSKPTLVEEYGEF